MTWKKKNYSIQAHLLKNLLTTGRPLTQEEQARVDSLLLHVAAETEIAGLCSAMIENRSYIQESSRLDLLVNLLTQIDTSKSGAMLASIDDPLAGEVVVKVLRHFINECKVQGNSSSYEQERAREQLDTVFNYCIKYPEVLTLVPELLETLPYDWESRTYGNLIRMATPEKWLACIKHFVHLLWASDSSTLFTRGRWSLGQPADPADVLEMLDYLENIMVNTPGDHSSYIKDVEQLKLIATTSDPYQFLEAVAYQRAWNLPAAANPHLFQITLDLLDLFEDKATGRVSHGDLLRSLTRLIGHETFVQKLLETDLGSHSIFQVLRKLGIQTLPASAATQRPDIIEHFRPWNLSNEVIANYIQQVKLTAVETDAFLQLLRTAETQKLTLKEVKNLVLASTS